MKTPDTPTNWEAEFDAKFAIYGEVKRINKSSGGTGHIDLHRADDIKSFIRDLLTKQASLSERQGAEKVTASLREIANGDYESLGWDLFFHGPNGDKPQHCCPGDDYGRAYKRGIKDAIRAIEKSRTQEVDGEPEKV